MQFEDYIVIINDEIKYIEINFDEIDFGIRAVKGSFAVYKGDIIVGLCEAFAHIVT